MLEETYINNLTSMKYKCKTCGLVHSITFGNLSQGHGCSKCGHEKSAKPRKLSYEFVKRKFKEAGLELLEKTYTNANTKMKYRCETCNFIRSISYATLAKGGGCPNCAKKLKPTYDFVQQKFKEMGLELLNETYVNNSTKMEYKCKKCGSISSIRYNHLLRGQSCPKCTSSKGEKIISKFCRKYNIRFKPQYTFDDLKYKQKLRFDFGIIYNNQLMFLIEFNGIQHYQPVNYFGGEQKFKLQQYLDNLKFKYCFSRKITLYIIRFDDDINNRLIQIFQGYFDDRFVLKIKRLFSV